MVLTINIENTHILVGLVSDERICFSERISTDKKKTALEYALTFKTLLDMYEINPLDIEGAIIASVVPPVFQAVESAVIKLIGKKPLCVGPGIKTGLNIRIEDPKSVGADLIACSVSAIKKYGGPIILIDLGTCNTVSVLDKDNTYVGGLILPGISLSMEALATRAAQLYRVGLDLPKRIVGKNTIECLNNGIIIGAASGLDGAVDRIQDEMGYEFKKIATGFNSDKVIPLCRHKIEIDENLNIQGLKIIFDKNK